MKKFFTFSLVIFILYICLYTNSFSQSKREYNLFSLSDNSSIINSPELQKTVSNAIILNINKLELISLFDNKEPEISLNIPYYQGNMVKLNLKRFDILSPNAKIIARTSNGNEEIDINDIVVSYTGNVEGLENTLVVINFTKDNVIGFNDFQ